MNLKVNKKKIIAILLASGMTLSTMPLAVSAAQTESGSSITASTNKAEYIKSVKEFETLATNMVKELKAKKVRKSNGEYFKLNDVYSFVYTINIDNIEESVVEVLIEKDYIGDKFSVVEDDNEGVMEAIFNDTATKLNYNTTMNESEFACYLFNSDSSYDAIVKMNKYVEKSPSEYFLKRDKYYRNANLDVETAWEHFEMKKYEKEDIVDLSVAMKDTEAKANIKKLIKLVWDATENEEKTFKNVQNITSHLIGSTKSTDIAECGAGFDYLAYLYIYALKLHLEYNPYKTLAGFARDYETTMWLDGEIVDVSRDAEYQYEQYIRHSKIWDKHIYDYSNAQEIHNNFDCTNSNQKTK
jgi:hypothetical protein